MEDLGTPQVAAAALLDRYLNKEFMSTRLGISRSGEVLGASQREADGRLYYDIQVRIGCTLLLSNGYLHAVCCRPCSVPVQGASTVVDNPGEPSLCIARTLSRLQSVRPSPRPVLFLLAMLPLSATPCNPSRRAARMLCRLFSPIN